MQRVERFDVTRGPPLMTALRRTLIMLATGATAAGLFLLMTAYGNLPDRPDAAATAKTLLEQGIVRFKAPPTPEQLAIAKQAAQMIVERARASATPR